MFSENKRSMKIQSKEITVKIRSNSHCRYSRNACLTVICKRLFGQKKECFAVGELRSFLKERFCFILSILLKRKDS